MRRTARSLAAAASVALLLPACGTEDPPTTVEPGEGADGAFDGSEDAGDADAGDGAEAGDGSAAPEDPVPLEAATAAAVADLARSEGVEEADVKVVAAEQVTWPDGSLGCPEPDGMYTQALAPGYRVVLSLDGDEVHYHGAEGELPSRCDDPAPPVAEER